MYQLRAREALSIIFKDVPLRTRWAVVYQYSKMFCWEPEGHYCCTMSMAIMPFWFSMEHLWIVIVPFWPSTEELCRSEELRGWAYPWFNFHLEELCYCHGLICNASIRVTALPTCTFGLTVFNQIRTWNQRPLNTLQEFRLKLVWNRDLIHFKNIQFYLEYETGLETLKIMLVLAKECNVILYSIRNLETTNNKQINK